MFRTSRDLIVASLLAVNAAAAQSDPSSPKTFFSTRDGGTAAALLVTSAGISLFDARIARAFQDTLRRHVRIGRRYDELFSRINESTLTVGGLAVYAIARAAKQKAVADVAFHATESVVAASLTSQVIRGPLGRTRPGKAHPAYDNQYDFHFFKGFTRFENRAFPSIHSSSGFAAVSAIVAEVRRRDPSATWYVAVPAYALALTPGLSRMYLGQHWASDIAAGAILGTFYGWRVVDYSHTHPTTRVDRAFLGRRPASIAWSITF